MHSLCKRPPAAPPANCDSLPPSLPSSLSPFHPPSIPPSLSFVPQYQSYAIQPTEPVPPPPPAQPVAVVELPPPAPVRTQAPRPSDIVVTVAPTSSALLAPFRRFRQPASCKSSFRPGSFHRPGQDCCFYSRPLWTQTKSKDTIEASLS